MRKIPTIPEEQQYLGAEKERGYSKGVREGAVKEPGINKQSAHNLGLSVFP